MILSHSQCHQMTKALSLEGLYHSIDLLDHSFKSRPETLFGAKLKSQWKSLFFIEQRVNGIIQVTWIVGLFFVYVVFLGGIPPSRPHTARTLQAQKSYHSQWQCRTTYLSSISTSSSPEAVNVESFSVAQFLYYYRRLELVLIPTGSRPSAFPVSGRSGH